MLLNTYKHLNGTAKSMVTHDDLVKLVIDHQDISIEGDEGQKIKLYPRNLHEIHVDYQLDETGNTNLHLVEAGLMIDDLETNGIVVFQKWDETHFVVTVKYYLYPAFGE